jgi:hypothetical protein
MIAVITKGVLLSLVSVRYEGSSRFIPDSFNPFAKHKNIESYKSD